MDPSLKRTTLVVAITFAANLPLGWLRGGVRTRLRTLPKRSAEWWSAFRWTMLYLHLSIPVAAAARQHYGLRPWYVYVPALILVALAAQAIGERFRKSRDASRASGPRPRP